MNESEVCAHIEQLGIVPVVRASSPELASRGIDALLAAGVSVFEVTLTVPGAVELIRSLVERLAGKALIGVGTVLSAADAKRSIAAGARFVVSPGFDPEIVRVARDQGVAVMPGALTPTEIMRAWQAGASMVKVFPCSALGGASYLKALKGPFPQIKLLPTGGVSVETAGDYIRAGAVALGVGGKLVDLSVLEAGNAAELGHRARALLEAVREARAGLRARS